MIAVHVGLNAGLVKVDVEEVRTGSGRATLAVHEGVAAVGGPDCMYGWGEPMRFGATDGTTFCTEHTFVLIDGPDEDDIALELIDLLVTPEHPDTDPVEVVATDGEDWSKVRFDLPIRLLYPHHH